MDLEYDRRELLRQMLLMVSARGAAGCQRTEEKLSRDAAGVTAAVDAGPRPASPPGRALSALQRATLAAATARLLPSIRIPGAREADVVEYIDRELARPELNLLKANMVAGTVALDNVSRKLGKKVFVEASTPPSRTR